MLRPLLFAALALVVSCRSTTAQGPVWSVTDDGSGVTAENGVLKLAFTYNAPLGYKGFFRGGGGKDGTITELYYKPTSTTRNLIFRNGAFGGKWDGLDMWEAEPYSDDGADWNAPDFSSSWDGIPVSHVIRESAGRLIAQFVFDFKTWHITRTYIVYPWGDITVHARLTQTATAAWGYLGHRVLWAASPLNILSGSTTFNWGGRYQPEKDSLFTWTDQVTPTDVYPAPYWTAQRVDSGVNMGNGAISAGRRDHYAGILMTSAKKTDPSILVMQGDSSTVQSAWQWLTARLAGKPYVERNLNSPPWAPGRATLVDIVWFAPTVPMCGAAPCYTQPTTWPNSLGSWEERLHLLIRSQLGSPDAIPLWRGMSQPAAPTAIRNATASRSYLDGLWHVRADSGATGVQWLMQHPAGALGRPYPGPSVFVVEGLPQVHRVQVAGLGNATPVQWWRDATTGEVVVMVPGSESPVSTPWLIAVE